MERNKALDVLKFVAMLFVVVIHCPFPGRLGFYMDAAARFSVPVFFMITGYFVLGGEAEPDKIKSQMLKLFKYYAFYEVVYTAFFLAADLLQGTIAGFGSDFLTNLRYILIAPTFGFQLWYIVNTGWALLIAYLFRRLNKLGILFGLSFVLQLAGIFLSRFSPFFFHWTPKLYMTRNFLFYGLFYLMLGARFRKIDVRKVRVNKYLILVFAIGLCFIQGIERRFWIRLLGTDYMDFYVSTLLAAPAVFLFALKCEVKSEKALLLGAYSMPIYFLHVLVIDIWGLAAALLFRYDLNAVRATAVGNLAYILIVSALSCVLYKAAQSVKKVPHRKKRA